MATLSQQSRAVIAGFRNQPGVTEDQVRNLHSAVTGSPALVDQFNTAVANGAVQTIVPLTNPNAGAEYDPVGHAMRMPLAKLTTNAQGRFQQAEVTFAMGHEVQHGLNRGDIDAARTAFRQAVIAEAQSPGPVHDYTAIVAQRLAASRNDEASAHLAGWNALASMVRNANPNATLVDVHAAHKTRADAFVSMGNGFPLSASPRSNLSFNADLSLSETSANVEAVANHWFDKVPPKLGTKGSADYPNYYGTGLVSAIVQMEHHFNPPTTGISQPVIGLDMPRLRFSEKQIEEAGLDFGTHQQPMTYLDMSQRPLKSHVFQHTKGTHQHVSPIVAEPFEPPHAPAPARQSDMDDRLRRQVREGVQALDRQVGRSWDAASERTELSLLVLARQNGLRSVDHVVIGGRRGSTEPGENVFLIEGGLTDPAHRRVQMKTQEAATTPVEVSQARLRDLGSTVPATRQESQLQQAWQQEGPALRH